MGRIGTAARLGGAAAATGLIAVLMVASLAWACTAGVETLELSSDSGAPGREVTVRGERWIPGTIEVFLGTATGNVLLGTSSVSSTNSDARLSEGRFRVEVTIPAGIGPGDYPIRVSSNGTFSRVAVPVFTVLAAPAVQPITDPVPKPQPVVTAAPAAEPALEQDEPVEAEEPAVIAAGPAPVEARVEARVEAAGEPPMVGQPAPPAAATAPLTNELVESVYLQSTAEKAQSSGIDGRLLLGGCLLVAAALALLGGLTGARRGR